MAYTRICTGCNTQFETESYQQKKCKRDCKRDSNTARASKRRSNALTFIGVDGEGVDRPDGAHDYVMLSVGDRTLTNPDGSQLQWNQIFEFLYSDYEQNKRAAYIGFYLGYDFTQWTKTLPADPAYFLWSKKGQELRKPRTSKNPDPFPVFHEGWEFDVMTKRRFRLRRHKCRGSKKDATICRLCMATLDYEINKVSPAEHWIVPENYYGEEVADVSTFWDEWPAPNLSRDNSWMYICDTGSFWQMSLMSAINPSDWVDGKGNPIHLLSDEEYAIIKEGKATRSKVVEYGDLSVYADMMRYNVLENDVLARMTRILNEGFVDIGLHIRAREWYGPGRAAQLWLDHMASEQEEGFTVARSDVTDNVPEYAREAGRESYYGGWFEIMYSGHVLGEVEEDDINSAYPWVISTLPCLHHGVWKEGTDYTKRDERDYVLLFGTITGDNPFIGAMPHRTEKGRILRPHQTRGWYWKHELDMAKRAGLVSRVEAEKFISYTPCDCEPPLKAIADLYQKRLAVGKKGPQGKALKLIYNSAYGKTAQSVGSPKYANSLYASLITAGCRTRILEAIATHPEGASAVAMVATDGIYFTSPHPSLTFSKTALGEWDRERKSNMTLFMPGVYWDDKLRNALELEKKTGMPADKLPTKTRGINVRDLADSVGELDELFWHFMEAVLNDETHTYPVFNVTVAFDMVSAVQAMARGKWETAGRVTTGGIRTINAHPGMKRDASKVYVDTKGVRTTPYRQGMTLDTTPYDKHFGMDMNDAMIQWGVDTPEGDFNDLWAFAMKGDF